MDDLKPNPDTVRFFELDGKKFRIYITLGGGVACDSYNEGKDLWEQSSLRMATEQEMTEILAARYKTQDEEIARQLKNY